MATRASSFAPVACTDLEEFEKLCPEPTPPGKLTKDGYVPDTDDPDYQSVRAEYQKRRTAYIVVRSLVPSQIEWDTVQLDNPSTWANWDNRPQGQRPFADGVQPRPGVGAGGQLPRRGQTQEGPRGFSTRSAAGTSSIIWPEYRTGEYAIWKACARLGIRPPGVKACWDDSAFTRKP